MIIQRRIQ